MLRLAESWEGLPAATFELLRQLLIMWGSSGSDQIINEDFRDERVFGR